MKTLDTYTLSELVPLQGRKIKPGVLVAWQKIKGANRSGQGIVVALVDGRATVLWSSLPVDPLAKFANMIQPISRRMNYGLIAQQIVSIQPMPIPNGLIFYEDFTYKSGSAGVSPDTNDDHHDKDADKKD